MSTQSAHKRSFLTAAAFAFAFAPLLTVGALAANRAATAPSVIALNQKIKNDDVSITYAYLPKDGTLAIFESNGSGKMTGKPIGQVALKAGEHRDVKVQLESQPTSGTRLRAVLEQQGGKALKGRPGEQSFKAL